MHYLTLSKKESTKLKGLLRGNQGNVKQAKVSTGLAVGTLKRAADGLRITVESATIIQEKLLN